MVVLELPSDKIGTTISSYVCMLYLQIASHKFFYFQ
jgi:hypothetical protein